MFPRFFKDMPKNKNEIGTWTIEVFTIFPMRDNVVYSSTYTGRQWVAYLKVRIKAFLKDWSTSGEYYGIGWAIRKN